MKARPRAVKRSVSIDGADPLYRIGAIMYFAAHGGQKQA
jgi:hypothetical protein